MNEFHVLYALLFPFLFQIKLPVKTLSIAAELKSCFGSSKLSEFVKVLPSCFCDISETSLVNDVCNSLNRARKGI